LGCENAKIDIPEGQSILRSHLEGVNNIPGDLVRFCKGFFSKKNWTGWYFKQAVVDSEGYNEGRNLRCRDLSDGLGRSRGSQNKMQYPSVTI
jgi:hypothetical protein